MPEIDRDLAKELKAALKSPRNCAFVAGKEKQLLVSKKKIAPSAISEAREAAGGGTVFKGRLIGEEGKLVFETTGNPPDDLAKKIKLTIRAAAGLRLDVIVRGVNEVIEVDGSSRHGEPIPTDGAGEQPDTAAQEEEYKKRLAALQDDLAKTKDSEPGINLGVPALLEMTLASAGKQDFAKALQSLEALEDKVEDALLVLNEATMQATAAKGRFKKKLKQFTPVYEQVKDTEAAKSRKVPELMAKALQLSSQDKFEDALDILEALEPALTTALRTSQAAKLGAGKENGDKKMTGDKVAFGKAQIEWETARSKARTELSSLKTALRSKMPDQADLAEELDTALDIFDERLQDSLIAAVNARDEGALTRSKDTARVAIKDYLRTLAGDQTLKHLDANPFVKVSIHTTLAKALTGLAGTLGK